MSLTDGLKRVKVLQYVLDRPIAFELSDETEVIVGLEFHLQLKDGSVYSPPSSIFGTKPILARNGALREGLSRPDPPPPVLPQRRMTRIANDG